MIIIHVITLIHDSGNLGGFEAKSGKDVFLIIASRPIRESRYVPQLLRFLITFSFSIISKVFFFSSTGEKLIYFQPSFFQMISVASRCAGNVIQSGFTFIPVHLLSWEKLPNIMLIWRFALKKYQLWDFRVKGILLCSCIIAEASVYLCVPGQRTMITLRKSLFVQLGVEMLASANLLLRKPSTILYLLL